MNGRLSQEEQRTLQRISAVLQDDLDFTPGEPAIQNGCEDALLTVDATFDHPADPVALEITRLRDDFERPDEAALKRFRSRLERVVAAKGHLHWVIATRTEVKLNDELLTGIRELIDVVLKNGLEGIDCAFPDRFLTRDQLFAAPSMFYRLLDRCREIGIARVEKQSDGGALLILFEEISDSRSLTRPLRRTMRDNESKLRECKSRGYVTMLVIVVERRDAWQELSRSRRAPDFPSSIDHLFLLTPGLWDGDRRPVFHARRDDRVWKRYVEGLTVPGLG